jgi:hypothetical protein
MTRRVSSSTDAPQRADAGEAGIGDAVHGSET